MGGVDFDQERLPPDASVSIIFLVQGEGANGGRQGGHSAEVKVSIPQLFGKEDS
jgi:hypothetical protein